MHKDIKTPATHAVYWTTYYLKQHISNTFQLVALIVAFIQCTKVHWMLSIKEIKPKLHLMYPLSPVLSALTWKSQTLSLSLFWISPSIYCSEIFFSMLAFTPSPVSNLWEPNKNLHPCGVYWRVYAKHTYTHSEPLGDGAVGRRILFQHISIKPNLEVAQFWKEINYTCVFMG